MVRGERLQPAIYIPERDEYEVGIFSVGFRDAGQLPQSITARLGLSPQATFLDLHVDNYVDEPNGSKLGAFERNFYRVASFIKNGGHNPDAIVGKSHQGIIFAARFFGFELLRLDMNELSVDELDRIRIGYAKTPRSQKPGRSVVESFYACFQSGRQFMTRFGHAPA